MKPDLEIDVTSTKALLDSDEDVLLVDCRELSEWNTCKIEGAILIPMKETTKRLDELEDFREKRLVIY